MAYIQNYIRYNLNNFENEIRAPENPYIDTKHGILSKSVFHSWVGHGRVAATFKNPVWPISRTPILVDF